MPTGGGSWGGCVRAGLGSGGGGPHEGLWGGEDLCRRPRGLCPHRPWSEGPADGADVCTPPADRGGDAGSGGPGYAPRLVGLTLRFLLGLYAGGCPITMYTTGGSALRSTP